MKNQTYIVAGVIFVLILYITSTRRECLATDGASTTAGTTDSSGTVAGLYNSFLGGTAPAGSSPTRPPAGSTGDGLTASEINSGISQLVRQGIPESSTNKSMMELKAWRDYWASPAGVAELAGSSGSAALGSVTASTQAAAKSGWESAFGALAGAGSISMIAFLTIAGIVIVGVIFRVVYGPISNVLGFGSANTQVA
jgi:hypothetical protein